jgi:hypothetical protein
VTAQTRTALSARDLKRDANQLSRLERLDGVADIDDLGDAFVTKRERALERRVAGDDHGV